MAKQQTASTSFAYAPEPNKLSVQRQQQRAIVLCQASDPSQQAQHKMEALGVPEGTDTRSLADDAVAWEVAGDRYEAKCER